MLKVNEEKAVKKSAIISVIMYNSTDSSVLFGSLKSRRRDFDYR
jgi:hypothetical protein